MKINGILIKRLSDLVVFVLQSVSLLRTLEFMPLIFLLLVSVSLMGSGCQNEIPAKTILTTPSSQSTSTTLDQITLTQQDFDGFGVSDRYPRPQRQEQTFRIQLKPDLPLYFFHVLSKESNGKIDVFRASTSSAPLQTLFLDPNRIAIEDTPLFLNIADINFDGYPDIGVLAEGGALWGAFEYWTYDLKSGLFIRTPAAQDMREIKHNGITFDPVHKQIVTNSLIGAIGGIRSIYEYENNRIYLKKEYRQENREIDNKSTIHCIVQIDTYQNGKSIQKTQKSTDHECGPIPDIF